MEEILKQKYPECKEIILKEPILIDQVDDIRKMMKAGDILELVRGYTGFDMIYIYDEDYRYLTLTSEMEEYMNKGVVRYEVELIA